MRGVTGRVREPPETCSDGLQTPLFFFFNVPGSRISPNVFMRVIPLVDLDKRKSTLRVIHRLESLSKPNSTFLSP